MGYSYAVQYSPNQSSRGSYGYGLTPTGITIHWWGRMGQEHDNVVRWLTRQNGNTSAHEVISDGRVTHLIDFDAAAWHSGSTEGNGSTIGLECRPEMTAGDLETVAQRCADIENQLGQSMYYYGHSDWYATACPGTWYEQIGWIVSRVNEIHAGKNASPEEDDMPSAKEVVDELLSRDVIETPWGSKDNPTWNVKNALENIWKQSWALGVDTVQVAEESEPNHMWWGMNALGLLVRRQRKMDATLAGLNAAVAALSADSGLTPERVEQIVRDAVEQNIEITGTVEVSGEEQA